MKLNITGLSPDDTIAEARKFIDIGIEWAVDATESLIADKGGTPEEIEAECARTYAECTASRDAYLAELRRQLDEPRAPTVLLQ
jgi:3-oxoacyl-(acyl-carrier-protein) synthase